MLDGSVRLERPDLRRAAVAPVDLHDGVVDGLTRPIEPTLLALGPVIDGVALNITVQSYRESLFVGINACASAVADLPGLTRAMVDELSLLCRMAAGAGDPQRPVPARRAAGGHVPASTPGAIRRLGAPTPI